MSILGGSIEVPSFSLLSYQVRDLESSGKSSFEKLKTLSLFEGVVV